MICSGGRGDEVDIIGQHSLAIFIHLTDDATFAIGRRRLPDHEVELSRTNGDMVRESAELG